MASSSELDEKVNIIVDNSMDLGEGMCLASNIVARWSKIK
jgi:hypothetical protein